MPRPKMVKITKDGQEALVTPKSVSVYERHGWTAADDGSSEQPASPVAADQSKEG
jgi:hypothetical protein